MQRKVKLGGVAMVGLLALSACVPKSPCELAPPSDRVAAAGQMSDCLNTLQVTPVAQMPTVGTATYNGFVTGTMQTASGSDSLVGDASLTASFASNSTSVAGTLGNFASGNGVTISGTLAVAAATPALFPSNTLTGNITGSLTYGGSAATFAVPVNGGYLGDGADAITLINPADSAGNATGTVTLPGFTGTTGLAIVALKP